MPTSRHSSRGTTLQTSMRAALTDEFVTYRFRRHPSSLLGDDVRLEYFGLTRKAVVNDTQRRLVAIGTRVSRLTNSILRQ
jgi:hypothetical protein